MRRIILTFIAAIAILAALGGTVVAASGGDSSTVTRPRLERSIATTFANLYAKKAAMQGRSGITPASLNTQAMCDKAGPANLDVGPGGDWVCLVGWTDPQNPMPPEGYGKFELNVHSNDCWSAGGPTKLNGFLTMTDKSGNVVTNPVFEFDGCFDPNGDNTPTGVVFQSTLTITSTVLTPDAQGNTGLQVSCGSGDQGCVGSIRVSDGTNSLGSIPVNLKEESTATLQLPQAVPAGTTELVFTPMLTTGFQPDPPKPVTLPVQ